MSLTDPLQVLPFWLERQIDPASPDFLPGSAAEPRNLTHRRVTTVGVRARPERAAVDARGLVTPDRAEWSIDWWVGTEAEGATRTKPGVHWHWPSRSRAVRQRLVGAAPVVETVMRVPGGEILHRAYGFLSTELGPCAAIEIENRSAVPVAVALAVRPYHPLGVGQVRSIALAGGTVHVDDRPALVLARPPAEARFGDGHRDVLDSLVAGDDPVPGSEWSVRDGSGRVTAALVSPLAHTAVLRAVVPLAAEGLGGGRGPLAWPDPVPSAEQVAKGWEAHVRQGVRLDLPDPRWQQVVDTAVTHLLLAHGGEDVATWPAGPPPELHDVAAVVRALDLWGFAEEAAQVLTTWPERQALDGAFASHTRRHDAAGSALGAVADHWRLTGDTELVETLVGPLAKAAHWIRKRRGARRATRDPQAVGLLPEGTAPAGGGPAGTYLRDAAVSARALLDVADALDAAGQPEVAADSRRLAADLRADIEATVAAVAPDGAPVPATPSRRVDAGVVVNVDLFEPFGVLPLDTDQARATLDAIRALPAGDTAAVPNLDGPAGLSPALTARLATLEIDLGDPRALDRLGWLFDVGGPTVAWPAALHPRTGDGAVGAPQDPAATAAFLIALRRLLVHERADGSGLVLCPVVPPAWLGRSLDVRRAPTAFGRFSYSVRWHGERPAVLWELEPHAGAADHPVTLTAPGLDPAWSATGATGEALLSPVALPAAEESFS